MKFAEKINAYMAVSHADRETVPVVLDGETMDCTFRVLPFIEIDLLRVFGVGDNGKMDRKRFAGNNIRWLAATLYDENDELYHADKIESWPSAYIDTLAAAARTVNKQNVTTEETAKNSDATAEAGT